MEHATVEMERIGEKVTQLCIRAGRVGEHQLVSKQLHLDDSGVVQGNLPWPLGPSVALHGLCTDKRWGPKADICPMS